MTPMTVAEPLREIINVKLIPPSINPEVAASRFAKD
jgi:hypothetical protein